jgi:DNA-directed RNA polymerase subunit RPC12/RpoP
MENFRIKPEAICPLCGGDVEVLMHPSNPPQTHYRCLKCGRHKDVRHEEHQPEIAPFNS